MSESQAGIKILVADDQADIRRSAELLFKSEGMACKSVDTPERALKALEQQDCALVLLDLNYQRDTTSGGEGLKLIEQVRKYDEQLPIVVMTAWASVDIAVEAMKRGANDFIVKPWDVERLLSIVKTQLALSRALFKQKKLEGENRLLRECQSKKLLLESPAMQDIVQCFEQISGADVGVLLTGENGTGKTRMARLCHELSARASGPFISVNMGALAESVFESEIFGHEKGAFTGAESLRIGRFELADGGTLFLDEIANISEKQQAALLRLLETGEFERVGSSKTLSADVRIICATNANLQQAVADGSFRQDLYYRISTVPVRIPSLAERSEDIIPLANYFLSQAKLRLGRSDLRFSDAALEQLCTYCWPGNVRELEHCIERAALLSPGPQIEPSVLGLSHVAVNINAPTGAAGLDGLTLAQVEYQMLDAALIKYMKKPDDAAEALGISRSAFYRKLAKHGFDLS
ncbi:sigma-54-dependent transcriptional regulator [Agaribacterium haliotis]|uniref:sigma-54-dependent transcriptional regulator n=1 Tax=Agaribacterium haliotis TaxID=2013869 RepID=UPI000BB597A9|nr:sigma-54 dependent transcriptional regulator [Agaribacterium haliotis]